MKGCQRTTFEPHTGPIEMVMWEQETSELSLHGDGR
jgi:hypothetical protein